MENLRPPESVVGKTVFKSLYIYVPWKRARCFRVQSFNSHMSYRYPSHFADEQTGSDVAHITQPGSGAESDITAMLLK